MAETSETAAPGTIAFLALQLNRPTFKIRG
jgi:hypothetical protein